MNKEEIEKQIEELNKVRPEALTEDALNLYNFIMNKLDYIEELEHKIKGQECVIETQMHNEEVYEELVKKLEKELNDLKRDFDDVDHECDRLEKIDVEKDLKIEKLENKIKELEEMDLSLVYIDGYFKGKDDNRKLK